MPYEAYEPTGEPNGSWAEHPRDEGCDLFPACLTCPLVRCRFEESVATDPVLEVLRDSLNAGIAAAAAPYRDRGYPLRALAPVGLEAIGLSRMTDESDMTYAIRLSIAGISRRDIQHWAGVGRYATLKEKTHA